ncbi:MAG: PIN domain-containing protein [Nanoarchaeota archaeon]|nr:PIN domain-containing protein [Nanoarchaeota archaeon]MBU0962780.1 PIN domain-containing protein [Nanoarchaeota archaeon]
MGLIKYYFDTYALYEFCIGNENYKKYFEKYDVVTINFNLIELFYALLKNFGLYKAREYYNMFKSFTIKIPDEVIEKAMIFRLENKKQDLSYVDCLGYILAKENNLIFLTGDKEFEKIEGVEFVK